MCPTMLLLMVVGGVHTRTMLAEASIGEGLVDRCSFWWWERRAELIQRCGGRGADWLAVLCGQTVLLGVVYWMALLWS